MSAKESDRPPGEPRICAAVAPVPCSRRASAIDTAPSAIRAVRRPDRMGTRSRWRVLATGLSACTARMSDSRGYSCAHKSLAWWILLTLSLGCVIGIAAPAEAAIGSVRGAAADNLSVFSKQGASAIQPVSAATSQSLPGITEFPVPNSGPSAITVGPDGNLWFVEISGNNVGKITPQGNITQYPAAAT